MKVENLLTNSSSLSLIWWPDSSPKSSHLEYLPSICKRDGAEIWHNSSAWQTEVLYQFSGLEPYTAYRMKVYVRENTTKLVFPSSQFVDATTAEGSE
ncbi:hypothetical protein PR048_028539 [Dryococelus australis]|uniref:Fibronectin type-III domain-containing protein n=1 Tax=Dryococelus australis TaxID=614101 RepID=A0ABQ9GDM8_9NEOP|nr:hypothetical protein PR048_028539 [Dryococelus australis]